MKKITIVIPLDPEKELSNFKELNIDKGRADVLIIKGKNPSKNRNIGVEKVLKTKTEFVGFINGHTKLSDEWFSEIDKFFKENKEIDIVGGPQLGFNNNIFSISSDYALSSIFGAAGVRTRYKKSKIDLNANETQLTSANLVCKRRVFEKTMFDEKLYPGEDPKFISDAKKAGFKIAYSPNIIVYNKRRSNIFELAKQIYKYGKTRPEKENILETLKKPFFIIPSLFVIYLFLILFYLDYIAITKNSLNVLFFIPLIIYIFMIILFSFIGMIKTKKSLSIFLIPLIYITIHISYGAGFLISTLKYHNR